MASYNGHLYNDRGLPLIGVKLQAYNTITGALIDTVVTDSTGMWDFGNLSVVATIYAYTEFGVRLVIRGEITGTVAGSVDIVTSGAFRVGQTAYDTGVGIWLGKDVDTPKLSIGDPAANKMTWDGATLAITGTVTASLGVIGGWTISATAIYHDGTLAADSSGMASGDYPFYAGAKYADRATAPFRVTPAGALVATSATITGAITATSGSLSGLDISGVLTIGASGGIFQGTGTFAVPTTALKIYNSGGVGLLEMWGAGVKQVYFGTDGKLYAGAGDVRLDVSGIRLTPGTANLYWQSGSSTVGKVFVRYSAGAYVDSEISVSSLVAADNASIGLYAWGVGQETAVVCLASVSDPTSSKVGFTVNNVILAKFAPGGLNVDVINEITTSAGVTIETVLIKDGLVDGVDVSVRDHDAVTLAASADVLLGISGQALSLDTQTANYVFAGPATAPAAAPTFRVLVDADIPTLDHGAKLTGLSDDDHTQYALRSIFTTLGDTLYAGAAAAWTRLAGNITTTKKFLAQTGDGAISAAPAWATIADGDVPATHSGSAHHNAVTIGADVEHSLATQVLSGVDASTTQKGHASFATADFTIASGAVSLKADGHGAAKHTDRTRSIWLPPRVFGAVVLTPALVLFGPAAVDSAEAWAFDDTVQEGIGTTLILPADFAASGNVVFIVYWAADTDTDTAHVCRWLIRMANLASGDSINEALGVTTAVNANVPSATAKILTTSSLSIGQANFSTSSVARLTLIRNIASAADTMVGDALLLGVLVQYTADE